MHRLHSEYTLATIPVEEALYIHELTVNVFTKHNLKMGKSCFCIYHEGLGRKVPLKYVHIL